MVTAGEWFAAVFIGGAAIAGCVCFGVASDYYSGTNERHQLNLWGSIFLLAALAMGAWKF